MTSQQLGDLARAALVGSILWMAARNNSPAASSCRQVQHLTRRLIRIE
jgi:hypothetical protein